MSISVASKTELLRNCQFLAGVPDELLFELVTSVTTVDVPAGREVIRKGEPGSTMYVTISGRVQIHEGNVTWAELGAGEVFGEMAVLDSDVRSASVTTLSDSEFLCLERDALFDALVRFPEAVQVILRAVLHREREMVETVKSRSEQLLAYEKELEIGRRIQADFLPDKIPEIEHWEIATWFEAAREVAGDFLDVFELRDIPHLGIVAGDVCDKGVGAALYMSLFRSLIRVTSMNGYVDPDLAVNETGEGHCPASKTLLNSIRTTNRYVATTHPGSSMFASVFFGLIETQSGELTYINAGHEAPVIFRRDGSHEVLEITGGVLGLFPNAPFQIGKARLNPGDLLLAYSDGVSEARNQEGEMFTEQRILDSDTGGGRTASEFLDDLLQRVGEFRGPAAQYDDITVVAVKFEGG